MATPLSAPIEDSNSYDPAAKIKEYEMQIFHHLPDYEKMNDIKWDV